MTTEQAAALGLTDPIHIDSETLEEEHHRLQAELDLELARPRYAIGRKQIEEREMLRSQLDYNRKAREAAAV